MAPAPSLRREFLRYLVLPALALFLIPALTLGLVWWGGREIDQQVLSSIDTGVAADDSLTPEDRTAIMDFYRAHPATTACGEDDPRLAQLQKALCGAFDDVWQFTWARRLAQGAVGLGVFALLLIAALGALAWRVPALQLKAFLIGWRALVAISVVQVLLQATQAVWLSYWATALLLHVYSVKLIIVVVLMAGVAVVVAIGAIFKHPAPPPPVEGEVVDRADAPDLWQHLTSLASRVGTAPPEHLVAGIDDNFFVTESGLTLLNGRRLEGRVLFVSLPLLRALTPQEADAVFCHELSHFHGGDTATSARLGPALQRYDTYAAQLEEGGVTLPVAALLRLFRATFNLALKKESRRRELVADARAANMTSPDDVGRSLLKVAGYSHFRAHTEHELFEHREVHSATLGLQARIDAGLAAHVTTAAFMNTLDSLRVPHPFDTHPPLHERLENVRTSLKLEDATRCFEARPARTWVDQLLTAERVERDLWAAYEARFQATHEQSLAWRYLPENDAERALVVKYFPDVRFATDAGEVVVDHTRLVTASGEQVAFRDVISATVKDGNFSKELEVISHGADGKQQKTRVNLRKLGAQEEAFKQAFGSYWQRDQTARQLAAAVAPPQAT